MNKNNYESELIRLALNTYCLYFLNIKKNILKISLSGILIISYLDSWYYLYTLSTLILT